MKVKLLKDGSEVGAIDIASAEANELNVTLFDKGGSAVGNLRLQRGYSARLTAEPEPDLAKAEAAKFPSRNDEVGE